LSLTVNWIVTNETHGPLKEQQTRWVAVGTAGFGKDKLFIKAV